MTITPTISNSTVGASCRSTDVSLSLSLSSVNCKILTRWKESSFDSQSWMISVTLAILAALLNNFGVNLQKLAWTKKQSNTVRISIYRMYWLFGIVFIVFASTFDFVALAFGPQSVIAPLGALTMVANIFIAPWMHGETLHPQVIQATIIIIIGCVMAVASASHRNIVCDMDALFALYYGWKFTVYKYVVGFIILAVYLFIKRAERLKAALGEESIEYQNIFQLHRISYSALSGIFGAQSVLFARTVDLLFVGSTRGGQLFLTHPGTYFVILSLITCITLQLYWLNLGLYKFESLYNVPIFTSTWIVGTVLGGGVLYDEFSDFSWLQAITFPVGLGFCCFGVFFLSRGEEEQDTRGGVQADDESRVEGGQQEDVTIQVDLLGFPLKTSTSVPLVVACSET